MARERPPASEAARACERTWNKARVPRLFAHIIPAHISAASDCWYNQAVYVESVAEAIERTTAWAEGSSCAPSLSNIWEKQQQFVRYNQLIVDNSLGWVLATG
jgi:hypothetical protein